MPGRPEELEVTKVSDKEITLEWVAGGSGFAKVEKYKLRVENLGEMIHNSLDRDVSVADSVVQVDVFSVSE